MGCLLQKTPGEGTGPTKFPGSRGIPVGRVPPRGAREVFQQAVSRLPGQSGARRRLEPVLLSLTLLAIALGAWPALAQTTPAVRPPWHRSGYREDRLWVKPKPGVSWSDVQGLHSAHAAQVMRRYPGLGQLHVVRLAPGLKVPEAIRLYRHSGLVEYAEPDYWVHAMTSPNDPIYLAGTLWGLHNTGQNGGVAHADIDAPGGWDTLNSASNIIVAVLDSGVRYTHEDLAANMWVNPDEIPGNGVDDDHDGYVDDVHGINVLDHTGDPNDNYGHGTHVAGILGAVGNNGIGGVGVAWQVKIMACKFLDTSGDGSLSDAIECFDYALLKGARIINASWGGDEYSSALRSAVQRLRNAGIIVVTAAGNDGLNNDTTPVYPANLDVDNIVVVAATTKSDALADFSNYGATTVHLAAPGSSIYSTWNGSDTSYAYYSGSSMATPYVAGVFALMRARFAQQTYAQLIDRVLSATDPLPGLAGKCRTGGRVNLKNALGPELIADFSSSPTTGPRPWTVNFTNTSVGSVSNALWHFGDGRPDTTDPNPSHVFVTEGNYRVTLTVTGSGGLVSAKSRVVSSVANYLRQSTNFNWIDPVNASRLVLTDNGVSPAQLLPFPFPFYGQVYDRLYVGANGIIAFDAAGLGLSDNADLPGITSPNAIICPYWDNLNPASTGSVLVATVGESPHRRLVVSWLGVPRNSTTTTKLTFQAVLEEDPPNILFQYSEVYPDNSRAGGRRATVGLENETGLVAAKYGFNGTPARLTNNQAVLFVSTASGGVSVLPSTAQSWTGPRGGPFTPAPFPYVLKNLGQEPLRWSASNTHDWLVLSISNGVLNAGESIELLAALAPSATQMGVGSYRDAILFADLDHGRGNTTRTVSLAINGQSGILSVTPEFDLHSSGLVGGPFSPASQVYTLVNTGDAILQWSAGKGQQWITLSAIEGSLAANESTTVTVTINENASNLAASLYTDAIPFSNLTNKRGNTQRKITLDIHAPSPPQLDAVAYSPDGRFQLRLTGDPHQAYRLDCSTNLTLWTPLTTNNADASGILEVTDLEAGPFPWRFYRGVIAP